VFATRDEGPAQLIAFALSSSGNVTTTRRRHSDVREALRHRVQHPTSAEEMIEQRALHQDCPPTLARQLAAMQV
jgi:hypothetical protein